MVLTNPTNLSENTIRLQTISLMKQYQGNPFNVFYGVVDRAFKNTSKKCRVKMDLFAKKRFLRGK
jgi:hypothetical protein